MLSNQSLIRNNTSFEEHLDMISKRYPLSGKDDLTGKWYEQLFPYTDIMCPRCAKKYHDKGYKFIEDGQVVQKSDLCRFCGQYYSIPSNFIEVHLLLGRDSYKRISRLDQYNNTDREKALSLKRTETKLKEMSLKRY